MQTSKAALAAGQWRVRGCARMHENDLRFEPRRWTHRVAHHPFVFVREAPSMQARIHGVLCFGALFEAQAGGMEAAVLDTLSIVEASQGATVHFEHLEPSYNLPDCSGSGARPSSF